MDRLPSDVSIGILEPGEAPARHALGQQAFGHSRPFDPDWPVPDSSNLVARRAGRIVAAVTHLRFGQWWGGRPLPMGGIAGVNVAPEARGLGLARRLLREAFAEMAAEGTPISALFPTTGTLYRSVGYGWGGEWAVTTLPLAILPTRGDPDVEVVPADADPGPEVRGLYESVAAGHPGWLARTDLAWRFLDRVRGRAGTPRYAWEVRRDGEVVGYGAYQAAPSDRVGFVVQVDELLAADGGAMATLLALFAGNTTMADELTTRVPVRLLLPHLTHAQRALRAHDWWWMLRLVDLPAAVAGRGYPPGAVASVPLVVEDPDLPANTGPWVLRVREGQGVLERGGPGTVAVHVTDLATLFAGAVDPHTLAAAGHLPGAGAGELAQLAACFAGPPPTLLDFF